MESRGGDGRKHLVVELGGPLRVRFGQYLAHGCFTLQKADLAGLGEITRKCQAWQDDAHLAIAEHARSEGSVTHWSNSGGGEHSSMYEATTHLSFPRKDARDRDGDGYVELPMIAGITNQGKARRMNIDGVLPCASDRIHGITCAKDAGRKELLILDDLILYTVTL